MRRRKLLVLTVAGSFATAVGIRLRPPLDRWAARFGARRDDGGVWTLARPGSGPAPLAEALHALDALADGFLACAGTEVRGMSGGAPFVVRIA